MTGSIDSLNELSHLWFNWVWSSAWQSAVVAATVLVALAQGRRWNAPLRYAILLVALLKFAVPPLVPAPTGLFSWAAPRVQTDPQKRTRVGVIDPRHQEPQWKQDFGLPENDLGTAATVPAPMLTSKDRPP